MATLTIDNLVYEVDVGKDLLKVCLSLGFDIPYFCWHPALGAVGACRQCAVKQFKNDQDTEGKLVMACMTPAADGMRIAVDDPEVKTFHAGVIEWLMTSHPHDCPVCDEGGECHLQDMTVLTGHTYRRFRFDKRTFRNQDLGPFLNHEMNRCITCYRCVRFYNDYAGGTDLHALASKNHVYFGRHEDGVLENEFSGNLVEVCPTGVFTDKTLKKHYTRKWDLQAAPSVCVHCAVGCNTTPGERYGLLRRVHNRYNGQVNGYFLCDRGRYGYDFVNSGRRLRDPLRRKIGTDDLVGVAKADALRDVAACLGGRRVMGIGSPRAALEANVLLRRLVGPDRFYAGLAAGEQACLAAVLEAQGSAAAYLPSLHDMERADAVLILGEDVMNTAPRVALALRQAVRQPSLAHAEALGVPAWKDVTVREIAPGRRAPLHIAAAGPTGLDELAACVHRAAPDEIARLAFAVAHALDDGAPPVEDLSEELAALASEIAGTLSRAQRPVVVSGTGCGSTAVIQGAANVAGALCRAGRSAGLYYAVNECNSMGLAMMQAPGLEEALAFVERDGVDAVVVLENDLLRRIPREGFQVLLSKVRHLVVIDHLHHPTSAQADLVLPAATFAEGDGTLISGEGRAQRFFRVFVPSAGAVQESWRWLRDITAAMGREEAAAWHCLDDVLQVVAADFPVLAGAREAAPGAGFRIHGQRIPREPARSSGRTAIHAHETVHEPKPPTDPDSPLAFSMEGYAGEPPPALITHPWAPRWNSVQAFNKFQEEVGGPLRGGDPGVRLIEPAAQRERYYFQAVPAPWQPREGQWLVVPRHHIFGSEELSVCAPAVAQRVPRPYLGVGPDDAAAHGIGEGDHLELAIAGETLNLNAMVTAGLPRGLLALPSLPGIATVALPQWGSVRRVGRD